MPKKACTERSRDGYTLIELLVVLTIMAVLSIVVFINFKTFSQDQAVNKAVGQVQSALRLAQSNAGSGVTCAGVGGAKWSAKLNTNATDILCDKSTSVQKNFTLENVTISSIKCSTGGNLTLPITISYSSIYGNVDFGSDGCLGNTQTLVITLSNSQNSSSTKTFTISKGGAIDVF